LRAAYDEGAVGDWGALHLRQDLGAGAGLAAAGYAAFALAEATGRLSGTALLERLGRTRVLVLGGLTACAGMLLASLAPTVWLALIGFAATGLGLANLFPAAMPGPGRRRNRLPLRRQESWINTTPRRVVLIHNHGSRARGACRR
jgi:MFS family permease